MASPDNNDNTDWRSITALNAVSTLAQVGQFGIAFMVVPLWLAQKGMDAWSLSLYASSLWVGQLPGLALAPRLCHSFGARRVILAGLMCTVVALGALAFGPSIFWVPAGVLAGFGLGLRWIGLEPWLYHIAPSHAQGRMVGFHETLIGLAPIIAPALAAWVGLSGVAPLLIGIAFTVSAVVPLWWARSDPHRATADTEALVATKFWPLPKESIFVLGVGIAFFGGMTESAFIGLFAVFGEERHFSGEQIAGLLTTFGLGGLLMQYLIGWLSDHRGMVVASLVCSVGTALLTLVLLLPLTALALHAALFGLGGLVTAYLTLALIAATKTADGSMARNVSALSMIYTTSAIAGPLVAGAAVHALGGKALIGCIGVFAVMMTVYVARCATARGNRVT